MFSKAENSNYAISQLLANETVNLSDTLLNKLYRMKLQNHFLSLTDSADLVNTSLHIENIGGEESNFQGNFGQDYIKQFDEMILSFNYSSVLFR